MLGGIELVYLGVKHVEAICVPQRAEEFALSLAHRLGIKSAGQIGRARGIEIPTHRVRTLHVEHRPRVYHVAFVLAHLESVFVAHVTEHYAVAERSFIEKQSGNCEQCVKPAASLVYRFGYEIRRESFFEHVLVFKRVVVLRKRHTSRVEPTVYHLGSAAHSAAAFAVERDFVHVRFVQFYVLIEFAQLFEFFSTAYNVGFAALFAHPYGERSAPVAVAT